MIHRHSHSVSLHVAATFGRSLCLYSHFPLLYLKPPGGVYALLQAFQFFNAGLTPCLQAPAYAQGLLSRQTGVYFFASFQEEDIRPFWGFPEPPQSITVILMSFSLRGVLSLQSPCLFSLWLPLLGPSLWIPL